MKTVIVGGGIGGLVTALYLSQQGDEVVIYEKENQLGGRLSFIEKGEYRIDKGPTIVLLPEMFTEILEDIGINRDEVELVQIDPLYRLQYPDGTSFYKWSDREKQVAEINSMYPGEEGNFEKYMQEMNEKFTKGKKAFLERSFMNKRTFFSPKSLKTLFELKAYQTVKKQVGSYFTNKRLQEAFSFQTLYIGGSPHQSSAMYSLVPFSEHEHGIWYVKGGYASLVQVLERKLRHRGVIINLTKKIEKLKIDKNVCTGVVVNGRFEPASRVVLNGDFPVTRSLLNKKDNKKYVPSSGCLLIYLGVDRVFTEADVHQFFMTDDFDQHMNDVFHTKKIPKNPSIYVFHPSIIDDSLAPPEKGVLYVLIPVPSGKDVDWADIDSFVDRCLTEIEQRGFHGLREAIEWMEVRTPADALKEGLFEGGSFGLAPILNQSGVFRPQLKPFEYDNVFAVGASTHPGGGIPIVMQGAKLLAEHIKASKIKGGK